MSDSPQSPPKDVNEGAQSPEDENQPPMDHPQDPHGSNLQGYEFEGVKEQDRWLPIANVARIMKNALPDNAKIAKEAKECMQECVSEFISFITSEASEKCQQEKRKTVNGEDILFAMTSLGFENYAEALKVYLSKYREQQNQSNRERVMETSTWSGQIMGEKTEPSASGSGEYTNAEASNNVESTADSNYMYTAPSGHNGSGSAENY